MLKIRLTRTGKTRRPYYRVVVVEHRQAAQGPYVKALGFWDPLKQKLHLDKDELSIWLDRGARPTDRISRLLKKEGIKHKLISIHERPARGPKQLEPKPEPTEKVAVSEKTAAETEKTSEQTEEKPVASPELTKTPEKAEEKPAEEAKVEESKAVKEEVKAEQVESASKEEESK